MNTPPSSPREGICHWPPPQPTTLWHFENSVEDLIVDLIERGLSETLEDTLRSQCIDSDVLAWMIGGELGESGLTWLSELVITGRDRLAITMWWHDYTSHTVQPYV